MCLAQGPQRSDAGEARTRGPSVSSQALYHWATALPVLKLNVGYQDWNSQNGCQNGKQGRLWSDCFFRSSLIWVYTVCPALFNRRLVFEISDHLSYILAWEFVTRSCLKPQKTCSNHEIHALFEHGFNLTKPIWALICLYNVTRESAAALTDHFAGALVWENVAPIYDVEATLWRSKVWWWRHFV